MESTMSRNAPSPPVATRRWTDDAARGVDRPLLTVSPERAEAELRRALEREASERRGGRLLVIGPVIVLLWQLIGASFILVSAHTSSPVLGELLYSLSFAVGAAGGFFSVVVIYVAGAERGEW
jgi:hypothetical protein